jgi:dihydroneopterin aldolase
MSFVRLVGILPGERVQPQRIEIDLGVRLTDGDGIVDYRELYAIVSDVMSAEHIDYLEEIGDRIADRVVALSTRIRSARVAVRKPGVSLGGPLDYAEVVVTRNADD